VFSNLVSGCVWRTTYGKLREHDRQVMNPQHRSTSNGFVPIDMTKRVLFLILILIPMLILQRCCCPS